MMAAIVLSGGASRRMGRPKALLILDGETFISRIVRVIRHADVHEIVVVTGVHHEAIAGHLAASVRVVRNPDPDGDQLSSLRAGLAVIAGDLRVDGLVVALVDHPLVDVVTLRAMLDAFASSSAPVVRPVCDGRHGHPVIFGRETFAMLLDGDVRDGAKAVVRRFASREVLVPTGNRGVLVDVDTPEVYRTLDGADAAV